MTKDACDYEGVCEGLDSDILLTYLEMYARYKYIAKKNGDTEYSEECSKILRAVRGELRKRIGTA